MNDEGGTSSDEQLHAPRIRTPHGYDVGALPVARTMPATHAVRRFPQRLQIACHLYILLILILPGIAIEAFLCSSGTTARSTGMCRVMLAIQWLPAISPTRDCRRDDSTRWHKKLQIRCYPEVKERGVSVLPSSPRKHGRFQRVTLNRRRKTFA